MSVDQMHEPDDENEGAGEGQPNDVDVDTLRARVAALEEENERLREEYRRARQAKYQRTALGLIGVGIVALGGAAVFPAIRDILLVLGAIGVFAGIVTFYLTPERVVTASVASHVYNAVATNGAALIDELGLHDERIYVPTDDTVRLFVPQHADYQIPSDPSSIFLTPEDQRERGIAVTPTGANMVDDFRDALTGELADDPSNLVAQATDGLVEQFELVDGTDTEIDADGGHITVSLDAPALGDPERFDHPAVSFLGVAIAEGLDQPVSVSVETGTETNILVTITSPSPP